MEECRSSVVIAYQSARYHMFQVVLECCIWSADGMCCINIIGDKIENDLGFSGRA
jgi:hypothetical protein